MEDEEGAGGGGSGGSLFTHCLQTRYTYVRESLRLSVLLLLLPLAAFHTNAVNKLRAVGGIWKGRRLTD